MSRNKKEYVAFANKKDNLPQIKYNIIFDVLKRFNIPHAIFCDAIKISPSTLQKFKTNQPVELATVMKVLNGLYKITNENYTLNDIITLIYKD